MKKYIPSQIEPKWQKKWEEDKLYETDLASKKNNYYVLVELLYPSGDLHIGHWYTFNYGDILARFKRLQGYNTFFPNGYDAFGLPAENAAIQRGIHPQDWTLANIEQMSKQFKTGGFSFDWSSLTITCLPEYYKWNQWIFLKMYERGLVYRGKTLSNWCPSCQTVLANENVEAGKCWRCGTEIVQKEVKQWMFKITAYADRLIWDEKAPQASYPKALIEAQNKWIGKSEGSLIKFEDIEVFTTRVDTIFGATFVVLSPEHQLVSKYTTRNQKKETEVYLEKAKKKTELERKENKDKTGVFSGSYVKNPLSGEDIPVWIADYVLPGYGTGAVMAVPAHDERDFEFAKKFNLPITKVIEEVDIKETKLPYTGEGVLVNSDKYANLPSSEAREKITDYLEKNKLGQKQTQYHLHDWSISRQRYWGTPIPFINCPNCGLVPVPENQLPVELPYKVDYKPQGKPPLATAEGWVNVKCPNCGGDAKREAETMDTFMDSSWYFFRYLDPHNDKFIFDKELIKRWMPVGLYIGGEEHTLGHALYSRYFTKFFKDIGLISFEEFTRKRIHHGTILGTDGQKMSKSKGNVVNPDDQVKEYGADAVRVYLAFIGPSDIVAPWKAEGINGVYHFLQRVWGLFEKVSKDTKPSQDDQRIMAKFIKKLEKDIDQLKYNTSVAGLMEWLNHLSRKEKVSLDEYKNFLVMLSPFAPHITEELWEMLGEKQSIHLSSWPKVDEKFLEEENIKIIIQVNGKVRDVITVSNDLISKQAEIERLVFKSPKVQNFLGGKNPKKVIYVPGKIISLIS